MRGLNLLSVLALSGSVLIGCGGGEDGRPGSPEEGPAPDPEVWDGDVAAATRTLRPQEGTEADWEIFRSKVEMARAQGLDTIPMGEAMTAMGLSFLGTPYGASTLEVAGEEDVVVNLQELDCVTFVENVLALVRFVRSNGPEIMESEARARETYRGTLREIRYRGGRVRGYASRLHYFSDWIRDNEEKGLVQEMTAELGGQEDFKPIDFMTTHVDSYRQMANGSNVVAIQRTENELTVLTRFKIIESEIAPFQSGIQNGDIIAATSTVDGLDVAHTGLAYWQDSQLHLLHAPLAGGVVEVSRLPLAERILRFGGQDGIRVTRPLELQGTTGGN